MRTVESVLRESRQHISVRRSRIHGVAEEELRFRINLLRTVMFQRKRGDEAFHALNEEELAVLEHFVRGYVRSGQLVVGNDCFVDRSYRIIRQNLLCGSMKVGPEEFRDASAVITQALIVQADKKFDIWHADTTFLLPWRAGLAFADWLGTAASPIFTITALAAMR